MPRIDPYTFFKTLGLLLSPQGGIRSSEEVTRIVQLMQKFSKNVKNLKNLRCMYIQILKATKSEILEKFLHEKGWELLNSWLSEALLVENFAQCKELNKLFLVCPVTAGAIEKNEALKLVKQLTCDVGTHGLEEQVNQLAVQVLKKWMSIINPSWDHKDLIPFLSRQNLDVEVGIDAGVNLKSNVDSVEDRSKNVEEIKTSAIITKEVSGILVISRGSKMIRKEVHWKPDEELVRTKYFELDETERINVNKVKFATMKQREASIKSKKVNEVEFYRMKQREAAMEKDKFWILTNKVAIEDEEDSSNRISWKLVQFDSESAKHKLPPQEYGRDSEEKVNQAQRELHQMGLMKLGVLKAIVFNKKTPPEPSEPDFCVIPEADPKLVPWEGVDENSEMFDPRLPVDQGVDENSKRFDYSVTGWYPVVDSRPQSPQSNSINSTVQPEKSQGSLEYHHNSNSSSRQNQMVVDEMFPDVKDGVRFIMCRLP